MLPRKRHRQTPRWRNKSSPGHVILQGQGEPPVPSGTVTRCKVPAGLPGTPLAPVPPHLLRKPAPPGAPGRLHQAGLPALLLAGIAPLRSRRASPCADPNRGGSPCSPPSSGQAAELLPGSPAHRQQEVPRGPGPNKTGRAAGRPQLPGQPELRTSERPRASSGLVPALFSSSAEIMHLRAPPPPPRPVPARTPRFPPEPTCGHELEATAPGFVAQRQREGRTRTPLVTGQE